MAQGNKISSNVTGLRYAKEDSIGVLPGSPVWDPLDPNSYNDFGGVYTNIARNPINDKRSRFKGVLTDLEAAGGFNIDMTQDHLQPLFEGFMFTTFAEKGKQTVTAVSGTAYTVSDESDFTTNDLVFASGFSVAANNGLKVVTGTGAGEVQVSGLSAEASPPADAQVVRVGHQFGSGDLEVDASSGLPRLTTTTKDLTALGLVEGELIFVGGDSVATEFSDAENNGWLRVREVTGANEAIIDKSSGTMVTNAGAGKTMQMFFGRTLKNGAGSDVICTTYQFERVLGAPDPGQPAQIQAEYIKGAAPNEVTLAIDTANKAMADMSFIATDYETRTGVEGVKAGDRPALTSGAAFNTSSHITRIRMSLVEDGVSYSDALFAYVTELRTTINNNLSLDKAIGHLGGIGITTGTFEVGGSVTAYFESVDALTAIRNNANVSFDFTMVKDNAGIAFDMPLITLDDGRLNIEINRPVTIPLGIMAADGGFIDDALTHTMLISFFDYLPDAAEG